MAGMIFPLISAALLQIVLLGIRYMLLLALTCDFPLLIKSDETQQVEKEKWGQVPYF